MYLIGILFVGSVNLADDIGVPKKYFKKFYSLSLLIKLIYLFYSV